MIHLHCSLVSIRRASSCDDDDGKVRQGLQLMFRRHLPKLLRDQYQHGLLTVCSREICKCDRVQSSNQPSLEVVGSYLAHNQEECRYLDR
jgi:hypothetical protein